MDEGIIQEIKDCFGIDITFGISLKKWRFIITAFLAIFFFILMLHEIKEAEK